MFKIAMRTSGIGIGAEIKRLHGNLNSRELLIVLKLQLNKAASKGNSF